MPNAPLLDAATEVLSIVAQDDRAQDFNEAATRTFIIDPILAAIGYGTPDRRRVEVHLAASGQVIDYLLTAGSRQVVVEAKPLSVSLGPKEAAQLVGYCAQKGIRWALLTNGVNWHVFDNDVRGDWEARRIAQIDLAAAQGAGRLDDALGPLALFAHDALAADDAALSVWALTERARPHIAALLADSSSGAVKAIVTALRKQGIQLSPGNVVDLLRSRSALAQPRAGGGAPTSTVTTAPLTTPAAEACVNFYLFSASLHDGISGLDTLKAWLGAGTWRLWHGPHFRQAVKAGDCCCFYANGEGVVARAEITSTPDQEISEHAWRGRRAFRPGLYALPLRDIHWLPKPVQIRPRELRERLDAFKGKASDKPWGWFVQGSSHLTEHDFRILTGGD